MIVKKITVGYYVQEYDTKKKEIIRQEFIQGEEEFIDELGNHLDEEITDPIEFPMLS